MSKKDVSFIKTVYDFYRAHKRDYLPWRQTFHPYDVLVSELMLQQTQVGRVIPKYEAFMARFPTIETIAEASLSDILQLWQGLGYNRRAQLLHTCAQIVCKEYSGTLPDERSLLESLPGIGPYTAGAIMVFAYNKPEVVIETNIRTVYIHHFFADQRMISDEELRPIILRTIDYENPRDWYAALMDYGSHIKQTVGNNIARSRTYQKQSPFKGSVREVRGAMMRALSQQSDISISSLRRILSSFDDERYQKAFESLLHEGLIVQSGSRLHLPGVDKGPGSNNAGK